MIPREGLPLVKTLAAGTEQYDPCDTDGSTDLAWGVRYYWRVAEYDGSYTYPGNVWNFMMGDHVVVDEMESVSPDWSGGGNGSASEYHSIEDTGSPYRILTPPAPNQQRALQVDYDNSFWVFRFTGIFEEGVDEPKKPSLAVRS